MPILMTAVVPDLDSAGYDRIINAISDSLRSAAGFRGHVGYGSGAEWIVVETWESEADWRTFFDAEVRDHLPPGVTPTVTELHNVLVP